MKPKFRIVRIKGWPNLYRVDQSFFGLFWYTVTGAHLPLSSDDALLFIKGRQADYAREKANPKSKVISYH
jgi:hypothetical protein